MGIFPAAIFAQAIQAGSGGYGTASTFTTLYDVHHQVVFSGKVIGKSTFVPRAGMAPAEHILVKNAKGTFDVALGPEWYVKNQVAHVYVGENVRVIGATAMLDHANVVLAKQIINTDNSHVLALRDLNGFPYWIAARTVDNSQAPTPPANSKSVAGTVTSLETITINGVAYQAYVVTTADGKVNVLTAPTWYMNNQDFSIPLGTYITAVGGSGPISLGNGTILANSLSSGGTTILLNNAGFPVWNPYGPTIIQ
jgi:hypothetical protein